MSVPDFFELAPAPLLVLDLRSKIEAAPFDPNTAGSLLVTANPAALKLYGAKSLEELQANFSKVIGPEAASALKVADHLVRSGERSFKLETVNYTLDGGRIDLILHATIATDEEGEPDYARTMLYAKDITEGKAIQRSLRILSILPEANPNIVVIMKCVNQIVYINPAGQEWLRSIGSGDADDIRRLMPDDPAESLCRDCDRKLRQSWVRTIDGRRYDVKLSPLDDGERCMLTAADVTDFDRISRERETFYHAFREVKSALVITDRDGRITYVNPHFEALYGLTQNEVYGKLPSVLNPGRATYRELGYDEWAYTELFAGLWRDILDPAKGSWEGDFYNRKADGALIHVHCLIQAIRGRMGEIEAFIALPVDLSAKEAEELSIRLEIFRTIAALAELRDNETGNHILRVGRFARRIAEELKLPARTADELELFVPLHDIGKVGIPDSVLLAPRKLTPEEFDLMKTHTTLGWDILKGKNSLATAAEIALNHHERWDGRGYPNGIAGDRIPLSARITAVSDVYDALRSERPYKQAWSHAEALDEIRRNAGAQFDPDVVAAFTSCASCLEGIVRELPD